MNDIRDGLFDVKILSKIPQTALKSETIINCQLVIPNTNYTKKRETVYYGKTGYWHLNANFLILSSILYKTFINNTSIFFNSEQIKSFLDNDDDEESDLVLSLETSHLSNQFTKGIIIIVIIVIIIFIIIIISISIVHNNDDVWSFLIMIINTNYFLHQYYVQFPISRYILYIIYNIFIYLYSTDAIASSSKPFTIIFFECYIILFCTIFTIKICWDWLYFLKQRNCQQ